MKITALIVDHVQIVRINNMTDFACVPPCLACRENGCPKPAFVPLPVTHTNEWAPNRLAYITLPCGCRDIPWPLVHCLGDNFATMTCEKHGLQKLTKTWKKKAKTQAKKLSKIPAGQQLDIPPF